jgi:gas vesicle protein
MSAIGGLFKFMLGGAAGTAVGLAVGSLMAPKKGSEFQADVQSRIAETKVAGEEAERQTIEQLQQRFRQQVGDPKAFTARDTAQGSL